jgi:hypothetical protein
VETIEDLLASPSSWSLDVLEVYWDIWSWLHPSRNLHVDFYSRHKLALVSNPPKFEWAIELVIKVFTSSRCYLHWYLLNVESTLMAWFWRVFILLFAWWRSNAWVFGFKWRKRAELQKLGLGLTLLCSRLVGLLEY